MIEPRSLPSALALEDVLRQGWQALDAGRVEEALRAFDGALRIKPTYAPAWRAKGRALRVAGNPNAAVQCYEKALEHQPDDEASLFDLAHILHELGRGEEELHAYDELLGRNPRNASAWMNRGVALHEAGRFEEALACYDRILAMRLEAAAAWNNRGAALLRLGRFEEALAACDEAFALEPGFADAVTNRTTALANLGRDEPLPTPLALPSPVPLPAALEPRVLSNLGLPALEACRRNRPESADDFAALGTALLDEGTPEAALSAYGKAQAMGAGPVAGLGRLLALQVLANPRAGEQAAQLLASAHTVPRVAVAVARLRESANDFAGASAALTVLLERHPDLAWIWAWKGLLLLRIGRFADARAAFERATAADPTDADAWANLAAVLHREGRGADALAACDRALALDPTSRVAWNNKGVILTSLGNHVEAEVAFQNAAKGKDDPTIQLNRARLAESRRQFRTALQLYTTALPGGEAEAGRRRMMGHLGARARKAGVSSGKPSPSRRGTRRAKPPGQRRKGRPVGR